MDVIQFNLVLIIASQMLNIILSILPIQVHLHLVLYIKHLSLICEQISKSVTEVEIDLEPGKKKYLLVQDDLVRKVTFCANMFSTIEENIQRKQSGDDFDKRITCNPVS